MANYSSHIIMADKLYNKLNNKNVIDRDLMKLFSCGHDLIFLNRAYFKETHRSDSSKFFLTTIKYIKENNLQDNKLVMSYLYGHIAHYAFDVIIHPFIGKVINEIKSKSVIKPHTYLECEMDKYLIKRYGSIDFSFMKRKIINNKVLRNMINTTYRTAYGFLNVSHLYEAYILLINASKYSVNKMYSTNALFKRLSRINSYDSDSDFIKYMNLSKIIKKTNMNNIFNASIKLSLNMIKVTNDYLYNNTDILTLFSVFDGTPYNIGVIKDIEFNYNEIPLRYNLPLQIK